MTDSSGAKERVEALFKAIRVPVVFLQLRSSFRSKMCHIWDHLAQHAVRDGSTYFVLLGDDIKFQTPGWKREIEQQFSDMASKRGLPLGFGCICFRDSAFPVFPTFPVIHRLHLDVFGNLFPPEFINQHGDPYLFELYRRCERSILGYGMMVRVDTTGTGNRGSYNSSYMYEPKPGPMPFWPHCVIK